MRINAERWQKVRNVLDPALEMEPSERQAFIEKACEGDPELRKDVHSYAAAFENADVFPEPPDIPEDDPEIVDLCGIRLGAYRLMRIIGRGGMGDVYWGERVDGRFNKRVAVKVLRQGASSTLFGHKFEAERRILARLDHPNIVRLIDGGKTKDGSPYLVMDYIEGLFIDQYCNRQELGVRERLALFCKVCEAVDYAHHFLVVHRDIKPGNVMVTDGGEPKLLDFGVARLLSPEIFDQKIDPAFTSPPALTPSYASPEQIMGEDVTVATDVYSLGVLLYELLVGHTPYGRNGAPVHEILASVCNDEPELPSQVVKRVRGIRDARKLCGDLDNIVIKALEREPRRRYASVEQFAADIRAYLEGRPIAACSPTPWYIAHKFLLRNKLGVTAGLLLALSLTGGVVATTWQARVAQNRFEQVRKLSNALVFKLEPALENVGGTTSARKMLVNEALVYLAALVKDGGSDQSLQKEIAATYERLGDIQGNPTYPNLGDIQGALTSYQNALLIRRQLAAAKLSDWHLRDELATCLKGFGRILELTGRDREVLQAYREALAIWKNLSVTNPMATDIIYKLVSLHSGVGRILMNKGDFFGADSHFRLELSLANQLIQFEPNNRTVILNLWSAHSNLGLLATERGDAALALAHHTEGLEAIKKLVAQEPENVDFQRYLAIVHQDIGDCLGNPKFVNLGDWQGALFHYSKTLQINSKLVKGDPDDIEAQRNLGIVQERFGEILIKQGHINDALSHVTEAFVIRLKLASIDKKNLNLRFDLAYSYHTIGSTLLLKGDTTGALYNLERSVVLYKGAMDIESRRELVETFLKLGEVHERLATNFRNANATRHWQQAADYYRRALALLSGQQGGSLKANTPLHLSQIASEGIARCATTLRSFAREDINAFTAVTRQSR